MLGAHLEIRGFRFQFVAHHEDLDESPRQHDDHADHEGVGGDGEGGARLADTAQVQRGQQQDRRHREPHLVLGDERHRRADVGHRRGHRHRHGQHIIHQQRAGHRQAGCRPEVGGHHLVVTTAGRVGVHVLAVAGDHDEHDGGHRQPDPGRKGIRRQPGHRQHQEDLLGCVGGGRQRIGGEHRQRYPLRQQRVTELVAAERSTEDQPAGGGR